MSQAHVRETFPELDAITADDLRAGVVEAWTTAMAENDIDDLDEVPWLPPVQRDLGIDDARLVPHVRDVTACAVELAETLIERRGTAVDLDTVVAGALVHDVSKLAEYDGLAETTIGDLLGHPHYGIHVVSRVGLPTRIAHIVLAHTSRTTVEPATIEAAIVRRADEVAADAIRWTALDDLREA